MAEDKTLAVNDLIELRVDTEQGTKFYPSRVEDIQPGKVVAALPTESSELISTTNGLMVGLVKKKADGILMQNARVLSKALSPIPLLTLKPEGGWERVQRRWDVRLQITMKTIETCLVVEEETSPLVASILDISGGGLLMQTKNEVHVHNIVRIRFLLPDLPPPIEVDGEVLRVVPNEAGGRDSCKFGVRFINLGEKDRERIVKFIFQEQVKRRRQGLA